MPNFRVLLRATPSSASWPPWTPTAAASSSCASWRPSPLRPATRTRSSSSASSGKTHTSREEDPGERTFEPPATRPSSQFRLTFAHDTLLLLLFPPPAFFLPPASRAAIPRLRKKTVPTSHQDLRGRKKRLDEAGDLFERGREWPGWE